MTGSLFFGFGGIGGTAGSVQTPPDPAGPFPGLPAVAERLFDGHSFQFSPWTNQGREVMEFWVPAEEYEATLEAIRGPVVTMPSVWGAAITRRVPMAHPYRPGLNAVEVSARGSGRSSAGSLYSAYRVRVEFGVPPWESAGDTPMMSVRRAYALSVITRPGRTLTMESDGYVLDIDQFSPDPRLAYLVTLYGVGATNTAAIVAALAAPMNSATLYLPGVTAAPGFAVFQGLEDQHDFAYGNTVTKALTMKFEFRALMRHDEMYHPKTGVVDRALTPAGIPMVEASDLNQLFLM